MSRISSHILVKMYRRCRRPGIRLVSNQSWNTGSHGKISSSGEKSSFRLNKDDSVLYIGHPNNMKVDFDILKNYKSRLKCIGGYSEDDKQNFLNDKSHISFLNTDYLPHKDSKEKVVNFDLKAGQDNYKPYSGTLIKSYENFFLWITRNIDNLTATLSYETKFVFLKNVFTKLLMIPYGFDRDFEFYAVYLNGIVYLLNHKKKNNSDIASQLSRWGHKFEQFLTYGAESAKDCVVCNRDYRCVMTTKLGPHNLLFSASVDCFNFDMCDFRSLDPAGSILLACCFENTRKTNAIVRFKMLEWCISLAALNIPHALVGFRTVDGIVNLLKLYTEDDLSQQGKGLWDLNTGFTFANNALTFIEKTTKTKPGTVFNFTSKRYSAVLRAIETDKENFPPKWFTDELKEAKICNQGSN